MRRKGLIVLVFVFVFSFIGSSFAIDGKKFKKQISEMVCYSYHIGYDYGIEECRILVRIYTMELLECEECYKSSICADVIKIVGYSCGIGYADRALGKYSLPEILKKVDEVFPDK